ncbi:MAG: nucleotidyltransferase domain-containing protein [Methanosarcinales archaeon]|nr:nucleotidyltransferase domain-containing protein [Methanosarcinales archaeon]
MEEQNRVEEARKILFDVVSKLSKDYEPEQIVLFGSYAYGEPTIDSDIDLLIIKETTETPLKRWTRVRKMVSDLRRGFAFSPLVVTPSELEKRLKKGDPFFKDILINGKKLYVREGIKSA